MLQSLLGCAGKDWLFCTMNTVQIVSVAQSTCLPLHTHFERETPDEKGRGKHRVPFVLPAISPLPPQDGSKNRKPLDFQANAQN